MDPCLAVEREIDKVLTKFDDISGQSSESLDDLLNHIQGIKRELEEGERSAKYLVFQKQQTSVKCGLLAVWLKSQTWVAPQGVRN